MKCIVVIVVRGTPRSSLFVTCFAIAIIADCRARLCSSLASSRNTAFVSVVTQLCIHYQLCFLCSHFRWPTAHRSVSHSIRIATMSSTLIRTKRRSSTVLQNRAYIKLRAHARLYYLVSSTVLWKAYFNTMRKCWSFYYYRVETDRWRHMWLHDELGRWLNCKTGRWRNMWIHDEHGRWLNCTPR